MSNQLINNEMKLEKFLEATNDGKIFSATFIKKDGTIRTINCRRNVQKGVTGAGLKFSPAAKGLLVVFDMHANDFRMINLNSLIEAQVNGQIFKFLV